MLQFRKHGRAYTPARDIVQLFPNVIGQQACNSLAQHSWPAALREFAKHTRVDERDLVLAAQTFAKFVMQVTAYGNTDIPTAYANAGMDKIPHAALLALMSALGAATLETWVHCARGATRMGQNPHGTDLLAANVEKTISVFTASTEGERKRAVADVQNTTSRVMNDNDPNTAED